MQHNTSRSIITVAKVFFLVALFLSLLALAACQRERPAPEASEGWEDETSVPLTVTTTVSLIVPPAAPAPGTTTVSVTGGTPSAPVQAVGGTPQAPATSQAPVATQPSNIVPVGPTFDYTVQAGDTLFSLAERFDTDVDTLRRLNELPDDLIQSGQVLKIPGAGEGAQPAPGATPQPTAASQVIHTVQAGETLSSIAAQYGVSWQEIAAANNITAPNYTIYRSQKLVIPGVTATPAPEATVRSHTVQTGETLYSIAVQYGVTLQALAGANNITNPDQIYPGQVLVIP